MKLKDKIYCSVMGSTVYLLDGTEEIGLIDTGFVKHFPVHLENFLSHGIKKEKIKKIIVTHAHCDHMGGLKLAKETLGAVACAHPLAARYIERGDEIILAAYLEFCGHKEECPACKIEILLEDRQKLKIGSISLQIFHTPGHTPGSIAILFENCLFVGDTVFSDGGVGWIDAHWGSNPEDFIDSLKLIESIEPEFICPSHGTPFKFKKKIIRDAIKRVEFYLDTANGLGAPRPKKARDL